MKTLRKLEINSDKIIKNEELITLKGGYGSGCCQCNRVGENVGTIDSATIDNCSTECANTYPMSYGLWNCIV